MPLTSLSNPPALLPFQTTPTSSDIPNEVRSLQDTFDANIKSPQMPQELVILIAKYIGPILRPKKTIQELFKEITYLGSSILVLTGDLQDNDLQPIRALEKQINLTGIDFADCKAITQQGMYTLINLNIHNFEFGFGLSRTCSKLFQDCICNLRDPKIIHRCKNKIYQIVSTHNIHWQTFSYKKYDGCIVRGISKTFLKSNYFYYQDSDYLYNGHSTNNRRHGFGICIYSNGERYEGEWRNDKRHGRGTAIWGEATRYEGEFCQNKKHGFGIYTWPNGTKYEGEWYDDQPHGDGIYTDLNKTSFKGKWQNSIPQSLGIHRDAYEAEYEAKYHINENGHIQVIKLGQLKKRGIFLKGIFIV